jgi:hypothetical protein
MEEKSARTHSRHDASAKGRSLLSIAYPLQAKIAGFC